VQRATAEEERKESHKKCVYRTLTDYTFVIARLSVHQLDGNTCRVQHLRSQFEVEALIKAGTTSKQLQSQMTRLTASMIVLNNLSQLTLKLSSSLLSIFCFLSSVPNKYAFRTN